MATQASALVQRRVYAVRLLEAWHLSSLDAPCVAFAWCAIFNWRAHTALYSALVLALAVWILYAGDRMLDAANPSHPSQQRHRFHAEHRRAFIVGLIVASLLLAFGVAQLPHAVRSGWMLLGIPLAIYFALVHRTRLALPKECVVAIFFAITCALPAALKSGVTAAVPHTLLFGALCWINCMAIAKWEHHVRFRLEWSAAAMSVACVVLSVMTHEPRIALCLAASSLALLYLDRHSESLSAVTLRAASDAALLTPLIVLVVLAV